MTLFYFDKFTVKFHTSVKVNCLHFFLLFWFLHFFFTGISTIARNSIWKPSLLRNIIIIIIIMIIMSCRQHGYPWPSLATSPFRSSSLADFQGYIPYPHIAAECMFELVVLLLPGHMWESIGVNHLWFRNCFSSSVLHAWFVKLG